MGAVHQAAPAPLPLRTPCQAPQCFRKESGKLGLIPALERTSCTYFLRIHPNHVKGYRGSVFCDVSGSLRMVSICPESRIDNLRAPLGLQQRLVSMVKRCKDNHSHLKMWNCLEPHRLVLSPASRWVERVLASGSQLTRVQLSWRYTGAHKLLS